MSSDWEKRQQEARKRFEAMLPEGCEVMCWEHDCGIRGTEVFVLIPDLVLERLMGDTDAD